MKKSVLFSIIALLCSIFTISNAYAGSLSLSHTTFIRTHAWIDSNNNIYIYRTPDTRNKGTTNRCVATAYGKNWKGEHWDYGVKTHYAQNNDCVIMIPANKFIGKSKPDSVHVIFQTARRHTHGTAAHPWYAWYLGGVEARAIFKVTEK